MRGALGRAPEEAVTLAGEPPTRAGRGTHAAEQGADAGGAGLGEGPISKFYPGPPSQAVAPSLLRNSHDRPHPAHVLTEAVDRHAPELPDSPPPEAAVERVAGILHEQESVPAALLLQQIHAVWNAVQIGRHDRMQARPG